MAGDGLLHPSPSFPRKRESLDGTPVDPRLRGNDATGAEPWANGSLAGTGSAPNQRTFDDRRNANCAHRRSSTSGPAAALRR